MGRKIQTYVSDEYVNRLDALCLGMGRTPYEIAQQALEAYLMTATLEGSLALAFAQGTNPPDEVPLAHTRDGAKPGSTG